MFWDRNVLRSCGLIDCFNKRKNNWESYWFVLDLNFDMNEIIILIKEMLKY